MALFCRVFGALAILLPALASSQGPAPPVPAELELLFTEMERRRNGGHDALPLSLGPALDTFVSPAGQPIPNPWSFPGPKLEDPMIVGAPGFAPLETDVHRMFGGPVNFQPLPSRLSLSPAAAHTTPTLEQVEPTLARFTREAIARRGGKLRDDNSERYNARRTDRWEDLLAWSGWLGARMADDPVIVDDAERAFQRLPHDVEEEPASDQVYCYGPTRHVVLDGGAAAWIVSGLQPGRWGVWLFFDGSPELSQRASLSFFSHGSGLANVVWDVDQSENRRGFVRLGDWVASTARPLRVELRPRDGRPAIADAILFEPLEFYSPIEREAERIRQELEKRPMPTPARTPLPTPDQAELDALEEKAAPQ